VSCGSKARAQKATQRTQITGFGRVISREHSWRKIVDTSLEE